MVNYSKWDTIGDEDEAVAVDRTADFVKRAEHHKASMQLIATQLRQAWPTLSGEQTAHLLDFVQAQHRGVFADNTKRATEIVAFIEARSAPSTRPLHALALFARRGEAEVADAPSRAQAKRVFDVAVCALNTVAACAAAGGARRLFDEMLREPQGQMARRYRASEFAIDVLKGAPPDPTRPEDLGKVDDHGSWPIARSVFWQLLIALMTSGFALLFMRLGGLEHPRARPPAEHAEL